MRIQHAFALAILFLDGCGASGSSAQLPGGHDDLPKTTSVATQFVLDPPYSPPTLRSVVITFDGQSSSAVRIVVSPPCPCAVSGPEVANGTRSFRIDGFDDAGNEIATTSGSAQFSTGQNTVVHTSLHGIVAGIRINGVPDAVVGTPFTSTIEIAALDADGMIVIGAYATPLAATQTDTTGAVGVSSTGGGTTIRGSTDALEMRYDGAAIAPDIITVSGPQNTPSASVTFSPVAGATTMTPLGVRLSPITQ